MPFLEIYKSKFSLQCTWRGPGILIWTMTKTWRDGGRGVLVGAVQLLTLSSYSYTVQHLYSTNSPYSNHALRVRDSILEKRMPLLYGDKCVDRIYTSSPLTFTPPPPS
jgi:hypothetical protein